MENSFISLNVPNLTFYSNPNLFPEESNHLCIYPYLYYIFYYTHDF